MKKLSPLENDVGTRLLVRYLSCSYGCTSRTPMYTFPLNPLIASLLTKQVFGLEPSATIEISINNVNIYEGLNISTLINLITHKIVQENKDTKLT